MLAIGQNIEGEIETIAFGGEGILRYRGFVVFVPFTAIGDRISCCVTEVKRSFAKGKLVHLHYGGKNRAIPPCPYFGTCGGCQIQHLNPQAQLNYKLRAVMDALKHIGHLSLPPFSLLPASLNWAYRRHITLHLKPKEKGFEAGYISYDNRSLVVIETCPIFIEPQQMIIKNLQELVKQIENPLRQTGRVTLLKKGNEQFIFSFYFEDNFKINLKIFQTALQQSPYLSGILIQNQTELYHLGDPHCELKLEGLTFRFSPQTFIQNHPEQSANIYRQICLLAGQSPQHHILDLYCGFGMTSLLLAKQGHRVTGIENNKEAVKFAKENCQHNQLKSCQFILGNVEKAAPQWLKENQASLIIVNPPRQGLSKEIIRILLNAKIETVIYISCMPSTLARDLKSLSDCYEIKQGYVYDMFPQTAHVETLVHLNIKKSYSLKSE